MATAGYSLFVEDYGKVDDIVSDYPVHWNQFVYHADKFAETEFQYMLTCIQSWM